jgi:hypothetical protein
MPSTERLTGPHIPPQPRQEAQAAASVPVTLAKLRIMTNLEAVKRKSRGRLQKLLLLLLLSGILPTACATPKPGEQGEVRQKHVAEVTEAARQELRTGMTTEEVRAVLGEPDDLMVYSGGRRSESWKYYQSPDWAKRLGNSGPTTELTFVEGRLKQCLTRDRSPQEAPAGKP